MDISVCVLLIKPLRFRCVWESFFFLIQFLFRMMERVVLTQSLSLGCTWGGICLA